MVTIVILQMIIRAVLAMTQSVRMGRVVMRTVATKIVVLMMTMRNMTRTPMMMIMMLLMSLVQALVK